MANNNDYGIEDFLQDDSFIDWVLNENTENNAFWSEFLAKHPQKRALAEKARLILTSISVKPLDDLLSDIELSTRVKLIQQQAFRSVPNQQLPLAKVYQRHWFKIAAILLLFISAGLITYKALMGRKVSNDEVKWVSISNTTKKSKMILMNDGSLAVLNPGSEIRFPHRFNKEHRDVYLQGEAFFEVHKDPRHPFLVHSQNMITRVLGTSFTVKAYRDAAEFKVVVNTGKVWVYDQRTHPVAEKKDLVIALVPNQQLTYKRKAFQFKKDTVITPLLLSKEIAKKELNFTNMPLSTVISKLDMAYGIQIEYDKETLGKLRITASLAERPLNEKIKLICRAINAKYTLIDGRIIID